MLQLAEKAVRGDAEAFLELMEKNSLSMYKVARGILKNDDDVADAVQDTILTCFEKIHTLRQPEYFKTWMIRILINECKRILVHYQRMNMPGELPETGRQDASLAEFEFKEMLDLVDEKYRVILILYYVEGFKLSEIADLLELNENTVKTRLSRARAQIRDAYLGRNSKQNYMSSQAHPGDSPADGNRSGKIDFFSKQGGISNEETDKLSKYRKYTAG